MISVSNCHFGQADQVWQQCRRGAYDRNPEQFINGIPDVPKPPRKVWINQPQTDTNLTIEQSHNPAHE